MYQYFLLAATFEGSLTEQVELMKEVGKHVDATVIITNQICHMDKVYTHPNILLSCDISCDPLMITWPCLLLRVMKFGLTMSGN